MSLRTIQVDAARGLCTVTTPQGRMMRASAKTVGMALLGINRPGEEGEQEDAGKRGWQWEDFLPGYGIAIGTKGQQKIYIGLLSQGVRVVRHTAVGADFKITFPPLMGLMLLNKGVMQRAQVFVADVNKRASMFVGSKELVLGQFVWGNIYPDSGYVCWGSVDTRGVATLKQMEEAFFGSGFNGDLNRASRWWEGASKDLTFSAPTSYSTSIEAAVARLLRE